MKSSDTLFQLIKTLSKGERRNFRLFAKLQEGDKQYLKLFEAIDLQKVYDENALLKEFSDEKFINQFSVAKNYLYNFILRTLHIFHRDPQSDLFQLLHQVQILKSKNLFSQGQKVVRKARFAAERQEKFEELLHLLFYERELLYVMNRENEFDRFIKDIQIRETDTLNKLRNLYDYTHLLDQTKQLLKKSGNARKAADLETFDPILNNPLVKDEENALSFRAKIKRIGLLIDCHRYSSEYSSCEKFATEMVALYESNKDYLEEHPLNYYKEVTQLAIYQKWTGKLSDSLVTIEKMRSITAVNEEENIRISEIYYNFCLAFALEEGDTELGIKTISALETEPFFLDEKIRGANYLSLCFNCARFFLMIGQQSQSAKWLNIILSEPKSELRLDIQSMSRILNILVQYELGNRDLIEYLVKSTSRFLIKRDRLYNFERTALKYLNELSRCDDAGATINVLKEFKVRIEAVHQNPFEQKTKDLFDMIQWIDSKLNSSQMVELVRVNRQ